MMVSLGKYIKLVGGGTPSKAIEEYWNGDIPWASVKDFKSEYLSSTQDYISQKGVENSSTRVIPKGTLLIATRMAVGKVVIPSIDVAINQDLKAIFCNSSLNQKFLFYVLKSKADYFDGVSTGATVKGIKINHITDLQIPLPPLHQQQKIANILDAADALRQNDKALLAKYDELIQALFLDMFGDPVSNPKGWEKLELGKAIDVRDGTHDSPKYVEKGYPLVTSKNIKNGELVLDNVNYISQEDYNKINNRSKVDVGDIIMPMIGTIGNPLLVDFEVNFAIKNVALFKFNDKSIITNIMLLNLLNGHFLERFSSLNNKGGTQKFVSLGDIRKMLVPIPPITLQNQFAERVTLIEEQKTIAQASLLKSEELFNSLLQKAFKGELVN